MSPIMAGLRLFVIIIVQVHDRISKVENVKFENVKVDYACHVRQFVNATCLATLISIHVEGNVQSVI